MSPPPGGGVLGTGHPEVKGGTHRGDDQQSDVWPRKEYLDISKQLINASCVVGKMQLNTNENIKL